MSKITFLAKIKLFISSHLVPVIATSAVLVVGVSAGVVAIVLNNQPKQETSLNQENTDLAQNSENEKPKQEDKTDNKIENSGSSTNAGDKSPEQNTSKPNTSQNQNNGSSQSKPVEKPSNSDTNNNSNNSGSNQTPAPSKPNIPNQPTQPEKTVYYYACLGTSEDPTVKQELQAIFAGNQDYMVYTFFENPEKITNCLTKLQGMSVPDITKKLNWQLIEFGSAEELLRWPGPYK